MIVVNLAPRSNAHQLHFDRIRVRGNRVLREWALLGHFYQGAPPLGAAIEENSNISHTFKW